MHPDRVESKTAMIIRKLRQQVLSLKKRLAKQKAASVCPTCKRYDGDVHG